MNLVHLEVSTVFGPYSFIKTYQNDLLEYLNKLIGIVASNNVNIYFSLPFLEDASFQTPKNNWKSMSETQYQSKNIHYFSFILILAIFDTNNVSLDPTIFQTDLDENNCNS